MSNKKYEKEAEGTSEASASASGVSKKHPRETQGFEMTELPGGKNVRVSYSRGVTVGRPNFSSDKADFGYSADFNEADLPEKLPLIRSFVENEVKNRAKLSLLSK